MIAYTGSTTYKINVQRVTTDFFHPIANTRRQVVCVTKQNIHSQKITRNFVLPKHWHPINRFRTKNRTNRHVNNKTPNKHSAFNETSDQINVNINNVRPSVVQPNTNTNRRNENYHLNNVRDQFYPDFNAVYDQNFYTEYGMNYDESQCIEDILSAMEMEKFHL